MIVFPNCKINLGLNVINKREDGYHNLETVFYPLPFYDVLEVIQSADTEELCQLFLSGIKIEGSNENNLCVKAYFLLKKDFPQLPAVKIYLHKIIPAGAGLGGGSADGAFMLMLANDKFKLDLNTEQLMKYALELGSDCPFFIINKPCMAKQRGEVLEPVSLNLSSYKLLLVNPGIHVNTGWAFQQATLLKAGETEKIIQQPVENWKSKLTNDFEVPVFEKYPEIETIKNNLYDAGAIYASMSGTGSTVYGLFKKDSTIDFKLFPENYFIKELPIKVFNNI